MLVWKDRFSSDDSKLRFLRDFFEESKLEKEASEVVSCGEKVGMALDSRWKDIALETLGIKHPGLTDDDIVPTNILQRSWLAYMSDFCSQPVPWESRPESPDRKDKQAAELANALLKHNWREQNMDRKQTLLADSLAVYGMAAAVVRYNPYGGRMINMPVTNGDGSPVIIPRTGIDGAPLVDQNGQPLIGADGQPMVEVAKQKRRPGMAETEIIPIPNLFVDPAASLLKAPRAFMIVKNMPIEWANNLFPDKEVVPTQRADTDVIGVAELESTKEDTFILAEYFEGTSIVASEQGPVENGGMHILCANFDTILWQEDLTNMYTGEGIGDLPLVVWYDKFTHVHPFWGRSRFWAMLPTQGLHMVLKSDVIKALRMASNENTYYDSAGGEVIDKKHPGMGELIPVSMGKPPITPRRADYTGSYMALITAFSREVEELSALTPVDYGDAPAQLRSGSGLMALKEQAQRSRFAMGLFNEASDLKHARLILATIGRYYQRIRIDDILGNARHTLAKLFSSNPEVIFNPQNVSIERGSRSTETKAAKQDILTMMLQQKVASPDQYPGMWAYWDMPFGDEAVRMIKLQRANAYDIIDALWTGDPRAVSLITPTSFDDIGIHIDVMSEEYLSNQDNADIPPLGWALFNLRFEWLGVIAERQRAMMIQEQKAMIQAQKVTPSVPLELLNQRKELEIKEKEADNKDREFQVRQKQLSATSKQ